MCIVWHRMSSHLFITSFLYFGVNKSISSGEYEWVVGKFDCHCLILKYPKCSMHTVVPLLGPLVESEAINRWSVI